MNNRSLLQIGNIVAYVLTLAVNFFSQSASSFGIELFENTVGELGESRAIFFLPAGYVFAIWGIIYLGLGAFVAYQALSLKDETRAAIVDKIGFWFILSSIGNMVWLVLFLSDLVAASTIAMFVILASLLVIYVRLDIGRAGVTNVVRWAVHIPFSIYLGWITVATVANISTMLYDAGYVMSFLGLGADVWAVVMMVVALLLAVGMLVLRGDVAFALVIVWAIFGIYNRPFDTGVFEMLASLNISLVNTAALTVTILTALAVVGQVVRSRLA